ncbi:LytR family transcriptional regulator [Deinococcus metallilatus]|uniref:LCP family protein required for cell wall assembly n=1 Tax=Deinococcus metallilatus TaxID=1211322 RepID=A0AAJ5JYY2_9DEIO|nr:LCP family protein [Deinococcus metallilatus]MBB5294622.1 LCP family protein required for cell wall assembly [Deinococcus metallilatus]QBY07659.1 LytR family transcriptional regulator [Deinococcus metallilatus]RXJ14075.1 LytR family transcriptional regulator [Deinococcus metallilatus]TLK30040.1 LytR family transcriptional regulator [Deinococcus metallilatus]GMA15835.1 LytR family transcriptional regulator [Deinococcus metallilatus]
MTVSPPTSPSASSDPVSLSRRRARLRGVQVFGLSLAALTLGGLAVLSAPGNAAASALPAGGLPHFTLLLAGRDIVYCAYHTPCKNQDQRTGLLQTPNTDTLMLVKVDGTHVNVLNIPRDTNVGDFDPRQSPAAQKVNSRYWSGGPRGLTQAVETITGEPVDAYVIVRADYVARVIDALGGLDVTVPEGGIEWVDQAAGVNLKLGAGPHHLNGEQAVLFLRVRKGFGDDYGRIDHQKQALTQLAARLKSPQGLSALPTILGGIGNGVETNVDPNLLPTLLPELPHLKLTFATLPTRTIRGSFNLAVDREALARVWGTAGNEAASAEASPDLPAVTVRVVDASGANLGPALARALRTLGYARVTVQSVPASGEASQVFTQQDVQAATQLADTLGLPRLQGERFPVEAGEVGILLGRDARQSLAALSALNGDAASQVAPTPPENR